MYQINDYRASGRTTRLLAICRNENAILVYPTSYGRKLADDKGYSDVEVMTYKEALEKGIPNSRKYVIDDLDLFAQAAIQSGIMIAYSTEKPLPTAIQMMLEERG